MNANEPKPIARTSERAGFWPVVLTLCAIAVAVAIDDMLGLSACWTPQLIGIVLTAALSADWRTSGCAGRLERLRTRRTRQRLGLHHAGRD
jgi:hypothetical protein